MTEGVIWKELLLFSVPLLLGNLFQQMYNAVDSIVVGQNLGAHALAAVGSSAPIINLLVSFFMGISVGAGVIISRYFGARNKDMVQDAVHTSMSLTIISGLALTVIGVFLSPYILEWVGTPSDVMANSVLYLRIYFLGVLSVMIYNMGSGILRAVGDSKNPLYFLIISSVTNVILDIVFVVYFHMGIEGAAWATLISQTISAVLVVILLCRTKQDYQLRLKDIKCHK
ncbi:MAG: MATE family efflux transporter, partial [Longicatena sp.]